MNATPHVALHLTVADALDAWLAIPGTHRGSAEQVRVRRLKAALGHRWLDEITDKAVTPYLAQLTAGGLSPTSVHNGAKTLRRVLAHDAGRPLAQTSRTSRLQPPRTRFEAMRIRSTANTDQATHQGGPTSSDQQTKTSNRTSFERTRAAEKGTNQGRDRHRSE